jgi:hypothetical protein
VDMSQPQPLKRAATCSGGKIRHQTDSCIRAKIDAPSANAKLNAWLTQARSRQLARSARSQ